MTVWIHIGTGKTGTSSIQMFLRRNSQALRAQRYIYPRLGASRSPVHHNLMHQLRGSRRFQAQEETWEAVAELASARPGHHLVLSSEALHQANAEQVAQIRELLAPLEVRVVVYLRRQSDMLESWYLQQLKTSKLRNPSIAEFAEAIAPSLDYAAMLAPWAQCFGDAAIKVRVFEPASFVNGDLIDDFCCSIGLQAPSTSPIPGYVAIDSHNTSPGAYALALQEALRQRLKASPDSPLPAEELQFAASAILHSAMRQFPNDNRPQLLDADARQTFDAGFADSNARVLQRYLHNDRPTLFRAITPRPGNTELQADRALTQLSHDQLIDLLLGALREASQRGMQLRRERRQQSAAAHTAADLVLTADASNDCER